MRSKTLVATKTKFKGNAVIPLALSTTTVTLECTLCISNACIQVLHARVLKNKNTKLNIPVKPRLTHAALLTSCEQVFHHKTRTCELHSLTHALRLSLKRNYLTIPGTCHQSLTNISPDQRAMEGFVFFGRWPLCLICPFKGNWASCLFDVETQQDGSVL